MRCRVRVVVLIGVILSLCNLSTAQHRASAISAQDDILPPKIVAARKAALQSQLETLERSKTPKEEMEQARKPIDEMLNLLTMLENARERRTTFRQQRDSLPERMQELAAAQKSLDMRQPSQFSNVTEAVRDQYDTELRAIQTEIQDLLRQNSEAEARLAAIPYELEQRLTERLKVQQRLTEARRQASPSDQPSKLVSEAARLEVQFQLLISEMQALEAERQWFTQRGPLHDILLDVAKTKLDHVKKALDTIASGLDKTLEQEHNTISEKVEEIKQALEMVTHPVESFLLKEQLETARLRQVTAEYRQRLNQGSIR